MYLYNRKTIKDHNVLKNENFYNFTKNMMKNYFEDNKIP